MPVQQTISFDADGFHLVGTLHLPDRPDPPLIIGCHGLLANRHSQKQISLAAACNKKGMAYFRFDHRGCGESEGEFNTVTSLTARRQDLYHAIKTMQHHSSVGPLTGLFGSSFGGTVVLAYACLYKVPALITYAAPVNSAAIHHANIRDNNGERVSVKLKSDALSFDIGANLHVVKHILVVHSEGDETVPIMHAHKIFAAVKEPKKLLVFESGDHRMSDIHHQRRFETEFTGWFLPHE